MNYITLFLTVFAFSASSLSFGNCPDSKQSYKLNPLHSADFSYEPAQAPLETIVIPSGTTLLTQWGIYTENNYCHHYNHSQGNTPIRTRLFSPLSIKCKRAVHQPTQNSPYNLNPGEYLIINQNTQYFCPFQ